ncbi:MAG: hypothetical protein IH845_03715 [Nanoarchaeota archaeon]|nr:hypothetical protein [Nanoarchaeota archaeon]
MIEDWVQGHSLDWEDLDCRVNRLMEVHKRSKVWSMIDDNPFGSDSIDDICSAGWEIHYKEFRRTMGIVMPKLKSILFKNNLNGYVRDVTLFHELVHVHYGMRGDYLYDAGSEFYSGNGLNVYENGQIVEWIARKSRANPEMLGYVIEKFGFEPQIYDRASFLAFNGLIDFEKQLSFPFQSEEYPNDIPLFMDRTFEEFEEDF